MAGIDGHSLLNSDAIWNRASVRSITSTIRNTACASGLLSMALALSACSQSSRFNQGATTPVQPARPLAPAPLPQVNEGSLGPATGSPTPPPTGAPIPETVEAPKTPPPSKPVDVASVDPSASSQPVTRQGMVGAWTVSTGGSNCQIFLALTKWSGGYRAASRGCTAAALKDVQAWDVKGKQVVLVTSSGGTAATLFRSSNERFDGSTTSGGSISFSR